MSAPRLEVHLERIHHNARVLVDWLSLRHIGVTAVTKATLGCPEIGAELVRAGVSGLGDSRVENLERLRAGGITAPLTLIRSPMGSQAGRVVRVADTSLNTELAVISQLSLATQRQGCTHRVILMVELGDLREGIMPADLAMVVQEVLPLPGIVLAGIGTNLACQSGVEPDAAKMAELSALATAIEARFSISLDVVSGGNSANLDWAFNCLHPGRVDDLRLGEAILLGREPLHRRAIPDLHVDAFTLVAEVIESKVKPSVPWGTIAEGAFGPVEPPADRGLTLRAVLALGRQDVDPSSLLLPPGFHLLGASSDHLVVEGPDQATQVGAEVRFGLDYAGVMRAMTSPFITRTLLGAGDLADRSPA